LITAPLVLAIIGTLYLRNARVVDDLAIEIMNRATKDVIGQTEALFGPLARVVAAITSLGTIDPGLLRRPEAVRFELEMLRSMPQAESIYVGFARDGAFYQARRLASDREHFDANETNPPKNASFILRILDAPSGKMNDTYYYLAESGSVIAVERVPVRFDPRDRPWYRGAMNRESLFISDAYVFASSKRPGLTLSRRIATAERGAVGAVGADLSLATLSDFLARERVGAHGVTDIEDFTRRAEVLSPEDILQELSR
jgi:adenylate cyclase